MEGRSQERQVFRASLRDKRRIDRTSTSLVVVESRCHVLSHERGQMAGVPRHLRHAGIQLAGRCCRRCMFVFGVVPDVPVPAVVVTANDIATVLVAGQGGVRRDAVGRRGAGVAPHRGPVTTGTPLAAGGGEVEIARGRTRASARGPTRADAARRVGISGAGQGGVRRAAVGRRGAGVAHRGPVTTGTPLAAGGAEVEPPVVALVPVPVVPPELTLPVALGSAAAVSGRRSTCCRRSPARGVARWRPVTQAADSAGRR